MEILLADTCRLLTKNGRTLAADETRSAVRQPVLLDVVAVGLEQHVGAAMLADRFGGPLDHAVALAGLLVFHLAGRGNLEALFGARFGLQLGHLALLIGSPRGGPAGRNMLVGARWAPERVLGIER